MEKNSSKIKKITVLYNRVTNLSFGQEADILADEDTVKSAKDIAAVLADNGFAVSLFEVNEESVSKLYKIKTDFFFNNCGGIGNTPNTEHRVPEILEKTGVPYSGADGQRLLITTNKVKTKQLFLTNGIPTPRYQVFKTGKEKLKRNLFFPLLVKPIAQDCSLGIHGTSVITNSQSLYEQVKEIIQKYHQPALVEDYINTRELNVTVVGNGKKAKVLPISEIIFGKSYDNKKKWKIVDFAAKWFENSENYRDTIGVCPASLPEKIRKKIETLTLSAYQKICDTAGYARFDIRLSEDNKIYFLEINLNPDISDGMGAARSAKTYGWTYPEFLKQIINVSLTK